MKKLTAILLLFALAFNTVGYRFLLNYFEQKSIQNLDDRIDNFAYNDAELTEFQIPLNMPYYTDNDMQYVSGEVEIEGKHYQYVKRKVENNILHVWCLNNTERNNLVEVKTTMAKSNSENQSNNNQQKQNIVLKIIQSDFVGNMEQYRLSTLRGKTNKYILFNHRCVSKFDPSGIYHPPKSA